MAAGSGLRQPKAHFSTTTETWWEPLALPLTSPTGKRLTKACVRAKRVSGRLRKWPVSVFTFLTSPKGVGPVRKSSTGFSIFQRIMRGPTKDGAISCILTNAKRCWMTCVMTYSRSTNPLTGNIVSFATVTNKLRVHGRGRLEFDGEGRATRMLGTIQDITDRKTADQKLRESEGILRETQDRLALAATAAQMGMFDCDLRTGEAIWTQQHEVIFGYSPSATTTSLHTSQEWADRVHPEDLPWVEKKYARVWQIECTFKLSIASCGRTGAFIG